MRCAACAWRRVTPQRVKIAVFTHSLTDALIDLVVGGRLRRQIPIGLNVHPLIRQRITVIPQRRPACLG